VRRTPRRGARASPHIGQAIRPCCPWWRSIPEVAKDFGMVELDEHGRRVGDFVSGAKLKVQTARSRRSRAA